MTMLLNDTSIQCYRSLSALHSVLTTGWPKHPETESHFQTFAAKVLCPAQLFLQETSSRFHEVTRFKSKSPGDF